MRKTILFLIITFPLLFLLTGCDNLNGIDQYFFVTALGLDKSENDLLSISIQIPSNSSSESSDSSSSSQSSNYKVYTVEAKTIDEGINIFNNFLSKQLNLSHCAAIVISEELATEGIKTYFNTLSNNTELRDTCKLIVSSKSAFDILDKVQNSGEVFSSRLFDYLISSSENTGFTIQSTFGSFFQELHNDYFEPTTIYMTVTDNNIQANGLAIFKGETMVGHVDILGSIAHLILTNDLKSCIITIKNPFNEAEDVDLELSLYKNTDIKINIINGSPFISVNIYPEGNIRSSGNIFNYIDSNNIEKLEKTVNEYLEKQIKNYLYDITKKYDSDVIGFKGILEAKFLTTEEFNKIHWDKIFKDSFFDVKVETSLNSSNLFNRK